MRGGPVRTQAEEVLAMLADGGRCQVLLVTLPEATPVNELVETAFAIEERVGVQLGPIVVNQVDPDQPLPDPALAQPAARRRSRSGQNSPGDNGQGFRSPARPAGRGPGRASAIGMNNR